MRGNNQAEGKNHFLVFIFLSAIFSCRMDEQKLQHHPEKVFEKPFVASHVKPPVVTLLDTWPAPQTIIVPLKAGGNYTIKTDTGTRRIPLLPPISTPADFNIAMKSFNVEDGLALSSVTSSYCDNNGNLWFGTNLGGLSRYDGKSFTNYSTKQGLWDNQVFSIFQDRSEAMWFGTWNGVTKYDGKTFKGYSEEDGIPCCKHYCISQDKKGNIWFGTGGGATKYDGKSFTKYLSEDGLAGDEVYSILNAKNGDIWFGTQGGISKYDGKRFRNFTTADGLVNNYVTSILEDSAGNIWFGTKGGISKYDGEGFKNLTMAEGLINNNVSGLLEDNDHHLWIGTSQGVSEYDGLAFRNYTVANGLIGNEIYSMVKDKSENIWFTTAGHGICKYSGSAFTGYTKAQGLSSNVINSILRDKKGMLWLATQGEGVVQYDGKSFRSFTIEQGLANNKVFCIYEDKSENIWFATGRGVSCYNGKSFTTYTKAQGLADETVWSITEDNDGNMWFGTFGGGASVLSKDKKTFTTYTTEQGLVGGNIHEVIKDKTGNIWLVNDGGGASKYNGKSFENYTEKQGMVSGGGLSVFEDRNSNIWFATSEGLSRYDGTSFMNFNEEHGLPDQDVIDLAEDENGKMWLGTRLGLTALTFKIKTGEDSKNNGWEYISADTSISNEDLEKKYIPVFETFNFKNGYPVKDIFNTNSMYVDSNNILWAGTGDKLLRFDYKKIHANPNPPKVVIQRIKINNENISWYDLDKKEIVADSNATTPHTIEETELFGNPLQDEQREAMRIKFGDIKFDSITRWYSLPVNLVLPYSHNNVSFDFAAIEPGRPAFVLYQYMLEGYDNDWNPATGKTTAGFGNIHEGIYTFKLKAQSPDGIWSEPLSYSFRVMPPWYRSWWAYVLYALSFTILVSVFIRWRTRTLKKEKRLLEQKVGERTNELKKEKEKVESTLTELKSTQSQLIQSAKMASLGELSAGIAHEIQNPLNFVNNFSDINQELVDELRQHLKDGKIDDAFASSKDIKENEEKINHHGKRADAIIKGMLQHSRSSTGVKESTDINKLADEYLRLAYHGLRAKDKSFNATLKTDFDETISNINIIPQDIGRVILNLINNAFYAVDEKKEKPLPLKGGEVYEPVVTVTTRRLGSPSGDGGKVEIRVADNGNGIAQKVLDKIFQPFFTTKPTGQGTGLGLSLAYDIVKAHGGEIKVETAEYKGTAFSIVLPQKGS